MIKLRYATAPSWTETVLADFDSFLLDHAGAEKKASGMAMSMALHYADKPDIVAAMIDLAIEELDHFREVVKIMATRNLQLQKDDKDVYVNQLRKQLRNGRDDYFLDRLLLGGVIEARGAERFGLIATALHTGSLKTFYIDISCSEDRHEKLFFDLAGGYFGKDKINSRLDELLDIEAALISELPDRPTLH
ncbi:MAG: tRNA-(ms[2]io[6]A)-hydroxylase [Gammaproteobacteria bacterium]|nr:MAG: tRNA-(ms[2]io[6]A)-hydroxylase [Gammaproteobacteria bacterium]RLA49447.1 MAG: tRNA-(ms[2]io[6]A)-hydroxylase [Gammaproteobacteria bacterium]